MRNTSMKLAALTAGLLLSGVASALPTMWIGDSAGRLGTVDVATGNVNVIGSMGQSMTDIAFDPTGNLFAISFGSLYRINTSNAQASLVGNLGTSLNSLVFDSSGNLYGANNALYKINTTTGAASLIGNGGDQYSSSGDLAFVGGQLFLSNSYGNNLTQLNVANGVGHNVGGIGFGAVYGMATNDNVNLYGMTGTNVIAINTLTGAGTQLINYGGQGLGEAWGTAFVSEAQPVPEPETYAMMLAGLAGLAWVAKRRQQA